MGQDLAILDSEGKRVRWMALRENTKGPVIAHGPLVVLAPAVGV